MDDGWLFQNRVFDPQVRHISDSILGLGAECGQAQEADMRVEQRSE